MIRNRRNVLVAYGLCCAMLAAANTVPALAQDAPDKVVPFSSGDPEMNAAIEKARSRLPEFWKKFAAPGPGEEGFSLKIAITDGQSTEHFWCAEIEGTVNKATCQIANEPQSVRTVQFGQRIPSDPARISDWMYRLNGKIKGGETIRVIVKRLPEEEAARYRDMLAEE